jgi:hypothetical protein
MAQLIIVHRDHDNQEMVLNTGRIIWAEHISAAGKSYTMVTLTDGKTLTIRETLNDLTRPCGQRAAGAPHLESIPRHTL